MIFQYAPQQQRQMPPQQGMGGNPNPYGMQNAQNILGGGEQQGPKKLSLPTWLFWLLILAFLGFAVGLWFWL